MPPPEDRGVLLALQAAVVARLRADDAVVGHVEDRIFDEAPALTARGKLPVISFGEAAIEVDHRLEGSVVYDWTFELVALSRPVAGRTQALELLHAIERALAPELTLDAPYALAEAHVLDTGSVTREDEGHWTISLTLSGLAQREG